MLYLCDTFKLGISSPRHCGEPLNKSLQTDQFGVIYFYIYITGLREETEALHREKKIHPAWRPPWLRYQILVKMVFKNIALKEFPASPRRSPVLCFLFLCDICVHSERNVRTMCWWLFVCF